ncbi:MAG TPA: MBL fold metallo-hydrolase [Methanocorpusculum sp.]|nr:MBL fold metallo-hydrolase [Methanocorpusculum sp.]HJJ53503.1 MBL fold metallo-hydrolase [Methanocorpusculum sp.]
MDCILLASGSKGNCIYVGNDSDSIIIDAGLGYLMRTLQSMDLNTNNLRGLCITHEHTDHVRSAKAFVNAAHIPVFASGGTHDAMKHGNLISTSAERVLCHEHIPVTAGGLKVTSFRAYHDAAEPTGFVIDDGDSRVGICLDTHEISGTMKTILSACDAVVLESNYSSPAMKTDRFPECELCRSCGANCLGNKCVLRVYPKYLKDRIQHDGHLSNEASSECVAELSKDVGVIALAHLSENYNRPNIARELALSAVGESGTEIYVSDQLADYRERRLVRFEV